MHVKVLFMSGSDPIFPRLIILGVVDHKEATSFNHIETSSVAVNNYIRYQSYTEQLLSII